MRDARGRLRCDWCGAYLGTADCGDEVEECAHCFHERLVATVEAQAALIGEQAWRPPSLLKGGRMKPQARELLQALVDAHERGDYAEAVTRASALNVARFVTDGPLAEADYLLPASETVETAVRNARRLLAEGDMV